MVDFRSLERWKGRTHLRRKLWPLDTNDSGCHATLGYVHLDRRQFDQATSHFERATALNPNDPTGVVNVGSLLAYTGRPDEGVSGIGKVFPSRSLCATVRRSETRRDLGKPGGQRQWDDEEAQAQCRAHGFAERADVNDAPSAIDRASAGATRALSCSSLKVRPRSHRHFRERGQSKRRKRRASDKVDPSGACCPGVTTTSAASRACCSPNPHR